MSINEYISQASGMRGSPKAAPKKGVRSPDEFIYDFLQNVRHNLATLDHWPETEEPYGVQGYRADRLRDNETYLAGAISWASR